MKQSTAQTKASELTAILNTHFEGRLHLARVKLIALFVIALCKVNTVSFPKLANSFDSYALGKSSLRRIQRFIAEFSLCPDLIACLVFSLLPEQVGLRLTIDRTNWKFGKVDINIFMLGVAYRGVAFPLLFSMLPKRGNSNTQERIALLERFIKLFGKDCIECLVADREFVGEKWIGYLNSQKIRYHIRIRNNFKVYLPRKGCMVKACWLFNQLPIGHFKHYRRIVCINGQYCYISGARLKGADYIILISFNQPEQAQIEYKKRWQIEMCFKAMKSSGFNMEDTHLQDIARVEKLVLLTMIAFVWCYKVGIFLHENVKPIPIKKHGRFAQSIFKYGLENITNVLLNSLNQQLTNITSFLSCT
jgi:hypothetical protein